MEKLKLSVRYFENVAAQIELKKGIAAVQKLKAILAPHKISLSEAIVEDAIRGCTIYESLLSQGKQTAKGQPAILAGMILKGAKDEAENVLRSIAPLREHLRFATCHADLIDFKSATLIQNAEAFLEERHSLLVESEKGIVAYNTGLEIVRQLNELMSGINPVFRSSLLDAIAYNWQTEVVELEPFDFDSATK